MTKRSPLTASATGGFVSANLVINEQCNFRCVMCDYWKLPEPVEMSLETATKLAPRLLAAGPERMTITGGEPLMHRAWPEITDLFCKEIPVMRLCTNGLLLKAHAEKLIPRFTRLLVSIDGVKEETFFEVRGVKGCPRRIWEALEAIKREKPEMMIDVKMTIMKQNFREILDFVEEGIRRECIDGVGFGMLDFSFAAFSLQTIEQSDYIEQNRFSADELKEFEDIVEEFYQRYNHLVESRFIFEGALRRFLKRYRSLAKLEEPPPPRLCTIPKNLIVVEPNGAVKGCFFLGEDYSTDELESNGIEPLILKRQKFDSTRERACRACDQLLFTQSPYEHASG